MKKIFALFLMIGLIGGSFAKSETIYPILLWDSIASSEAIAVIRLESVLKREVGVFIDDGEPKEFTRSVMNARVIETWHGDLDPQLAIENDFNLPVGWQGVIFLDRSENRWIPSIANPLEGQGRANLKNAVLRAAQLQARDGSNRRRERDRRGWAIELLFCPSLRDDGIEEFNWRSGDRLTKAEVRALGEAFVRSPFLDPEVTPDVLELLHDFKSAKLDELAIELFEASLSEEEGGFAPEWFNLMWVAISRQTDAFEKQMTEIYEDPDPENGRERARRLWREIRGQIATRPSEAAETPARN